MKAELFGKYVQQDCRQCSDGMNKDEYIIAQNTSCKLLLTNTSSIRADVRIWIQNSQIGTWSIGPNDEISLLTFPRSKEELRFFTDTVITVKFFQAIDNEISMDRKLEADEIENVRTKILIIRVTEFSAYDIPESESPYTLIL